MKTRVGTSENV